MKFRERIGKIWKRKSTRYGVAGTICLATAGVIFALNMGGEAQAETFGGVEFTPINGVYEINTPKQLLALSDVMIESGKVFELTQDIEVEITNLATGIFGGNFDGNGHIITITTPTEGLASEGTTGASEGLLFGTVTGKVENLIIEIPSDIKYTRTSSVGISETVEKTEITIENEATAPYSGENKFSKYNLDADAKELAKKFEESSDSNIIVEEENGKNYYKVSVPEDVKKTTTYKLQDSQSDQFGIICGTLDSGASINQVYIKGNENVVLNVIQEAGAVSNTKIESGTRKRYFYYEESTGIYKQEVTPSSTSADAPEVNVYNADKSIQNTNSDTYVSMSISAPYYIGNTGNATYQVTIKNLYDNEITLTGIDEANSEGTWKKAGGSTLSTWSGEVLAPGQSQTYVYTISAGGISTGNAFEAEFTTNYKYGTFDTVSGNKVPTGNEEDGILVASSVTSSMIDTALESSNSFAENATGLLVNVTPKQLNYLADGTAQVIYELKIKNAIQIPSIVNSSVEVTVDTSSIVFKLDNASQSVSWTQNGNAFTKGTISQGGTLTLTGTLNLESGADVTAYNASVTVTPSKQENTYGSTTFYQFIESKTIVEEKVTLTGTAVESTETVTKGNHLNAGIIAGANNGTITAVKQDMLINGTAQGTTGADLNVGGIVGAATGSASNLYILGTQNYAGEGSALPDDSILKGGTMPNNTNWTTFTKYEPAGTQTNEFDLSWLIKKEATEGDLFEYANPTTDGNIAVEIAEAKQLTDKPLNYIIAYKARKALTDTSENNIYVFDKIELGQSGFYRLLNAYATDGYYHYFTSNVSLDNVENATTVYPYISGGINITSQNVVRTDNPLDDKIYICFNEKNNEVDGQVYYNSIYNKDGTVGIPAEGSNYGTITDGEVSLPFTSSPEKFQLVPVVNDHIYPMQTTNVFNRNPLPKPIIKVSDYYDKDSNERAYIDFRDNKYSVGTKVKIMPDGTDDHTAEYTIRYQFVDSIPAEWIDKTKPYTGNEKLINDEAPTYAEPFEIPADCIGEGKYLLVEASKKNYDTALYYYGSFSIVAKDTISATINGAPYSTTTDNRVLNGDVLRLTANSSTVSSSDAQSIDLQYMISPIPTTTYSWAEYNSSQGIQLSESDGGYVYTRIKYEDDKFGEPYRFDVTFGDDCSDPIETPNTSASVSGAEGGTKIDPTTNVVLSSKTVGAKILYYVSKESDIGSIQLTRALSAPDGVEQSGDIVGDKKYFQVEEIRNNESTDNETTLKSTWYYTTNLSVKEYTASVNLNAELPEDNKLNPNRVEAEPVYISTVAIAYGCEKSNELEFVYRVKPAQQVFSPEAAFETRFTPGGEDAETASISLGSNLTFYSVTPETTLYYSTDANAEADSFDEIPESGVEVKGNYGGNFVVRVQARKLGMRDSEIITFVYKIADQELANEPTATPGTSADVPTTIIPGNKILLSTTTKGASIYYTIDGSSPKVVRNSDGTFASENEEITKLYKSDEGIVMPLEGKEYFTITAVAVKNGLGKSREVRFVYIYPDAVLAPYANIDSGNVELNTQILLKNLTDGAVIYYNTASGKDIKETDVTEPTLSSSVFSEEYPITITEKTIIKAMAAKDGIKSEVVTFSYNPMAQLAAPTASIETGSVVSNGTKLELTATKESTIYYTMDGSDPTLDDNPAVLIGNSIILSGEPGDQIKIMAFAEAPNNSRSEVATFTYQFSQNTTGGVTATPESGATVSNGKKIILMTDVTGADIYYTTDGDSPIEKGVKGTTVEVDGTPGTTFTIKAVAIVNGEPGTVSTFIYKIEEKPSEPTASPAGGTLTVATRVTLSSGEGKIYYTTDGTEPTKSSNLYNEPILINRTTTLKAIAVSEDGVVSDVATFQYTAAGKAAMPRADYENGQVLEPGTVVTLKTDTPNATIYYTSDGTDPTIDNLDSLLICDADGIEINRSVTIKAVAYHKDMRMSNVAAWNYIVDVIPAVEMKEAEAAKRAEEGLQDTDAEALRRDNEKEIPTSTRRVLKEKEHHTTVTVSSEEAAVNTKLFAEAKETHPMTVKNVKTLFGDAYTILSEYELTLKNGKTYVHPKGEVEMGIPIPKGYEQATLTIVKVGSNNKLTTLETRRENGMLYAVTNDLSDCAVVGLENLEENERSFPYLLLLEVAAGIALLAGIVYCAKEKWKKYKKRR